MLLHSRRWLTAACVMLALAACDDDPNEPTERLALVGCPTSASVNAPLTLNFTVPLNPATVAPGALVVSSASTGLEIPGSFALDGANSSQLVFTPASPFRFSERVRVRVQNLRSAETNSALDVTLCEFTTQAPPITELFWRQLPNAGGNLLVAAALNTPDHGFVLSTTGILSESGAAGDTTADFTIRFQEPRFLAGFDVDFITPTRGFASFSEFRRGRSVLVETNNAGVKFDSVASIIGDNVTRIMFDSTSGRTGTNTPFNVLGGGGTFQTTFYRYLPATKTFRSNIFNSSGSDPDASGQVQDLDIHPTDTARVAAVTAGVRVPPIDVRGWLWVTSNGGATWRKVAGSKAPGRVITYWGTAVRPSGETWIVGGSGFVGRTTDPFTGTAAITIDTMMTRERPTNADTLNPNALLYTDIEFAPDNPSKGWLIGAQLLGNVNGIPRYQGLIFETRDGGASWTRQGVLGAANYGAEFPKLNRLEVRSSTMVWIVGDDGTVLRYAGTGGPGDENGTGTSTTTP